MNVTTLVFLVASILSFACATSPKPATAPKDAKVIATVTPTTFACGDSLPRDDGTKRAGTPCNIAREYCFEASGGVPLSHGAHCRALPHPGATCAELVEAVGVGSECTGDPGRGLRLQLALP